MSDSLRTVIEKKLIKFCLSVSKYQKWVDDAVKIELILGVSIFSHI